MKDLDTILSENYGDRAQEIKESLKEEVQACFDANGSYMDLEDILSGYGLEMDYIAELRYEK